jgi:branched-subunit amino acid ABC-type transport system permease component
VVFGEQPQTLPGLEAQIVTLGQLSISNGQLAQMGAAGFMWIALGVVVRFSLFWTVWKATATNDLSATYYAIPTARVLATGASAAYVCAAAAGLAQAVSIDVTAYPTFSLFLNGAVVALLADGLSLTKLFFASIGIGSATTLAILIAGAVWQDVFSALALFATLSWMTFRTRKAK